jgi:hypothetical protein
MRIAAALSARLGLVDTNGNRLNQARLIVLDVADPASTSLPLHAALRVTS